MTIDFQKVAEAVEKASPEIKELMFSTDLSDALEEIAESNKVEEDIYLEMVDEVGYVILGLKSRSSFSQSLEEIGLEKTKASFISKEIESKIFSELDVKNTEGFEEKMQGFKEKGEWVTKVDEIAKKYGLEDSKKETLVSLCSETFSNISDKSQLVVKIVEKLTISRLLAEQIFSDLDARVFNQAIKHIVTIENKTENMRIESKVPEIRPQNLPMQGSNFIPPKPEMKNDALDKQIPKSDSTIGVPRYAPSAPTANTPVMGNAKTMIEKKLSEITTNIKPIETKYQKDPYREALE